MYKATDFALKNVKYFAAGSEETHCFEATLYIKGKRSLIVSNDGHGGPDNFRPAAKGVAPNSIWPFIEQINKDLGQTLCPVGDTDLTVPLDLEIVVGDLMNEWHRDNEVKRILKRVSYIKQDGNVYQLAAKYKPTPDVLAIIKKAKWWDESYILLNELAPELAKQEIQKAGLI